MAFLKRSSLNGRVEKILWCRNRTASLVSEAVDRAALTFSGLPDDAHSGLTRPSCVRVKELYEKGTEIRNSRQLTILSEEELVAIASDMGVSKIEPEWLGANIVLSGIPHLTLLPPSCRLQFASGPVVVVDLENGPCIHPARVIETHCPGKGSSFVKHARGRRGVTAWVEREGVISRGDSVVVHVPNQPPYPGALDI
ncbi:MAG: MOSC domain-containing protein [Alphaproteobacteria bacterium]